MAGETLIYSKKATGAFPDEDELLNDIKEFLEN